ncbi:hypothetical protein QJS10_CPB11g01622 [Acorus calamus]|uniref:Bifunctional inhibitor/plant lipid transfer protein/seed storage helical domain-containing protein n=1 Tax=Acorus calamus TaxID=4465 RepID=A0AAV9DVA6_ACOCL|nr:hypothetical protein QJS10_CPB11g01622 [Acorus calamus]
MHKPQPQHFENIGLSQNFQAHIMAPTYLKLVLAVAIMLSDVLVVNVAAQSGGGGCNSAIVGLAPCLNYVTGSSSSPTQSCCTQLASVVKAQPRCLCLLLNGGGSSFGVTLNETRALELPRACNVQTPPVSECNSKRDSPLCPLACFKF